jgi:hypothetical protein
MRSFGAALDGTGHSAHTFDLVDDGEARRASA